MLQLPRCDYCKHCNPIKYKCPSFPDGIPDDKLWADEHEKCNGDISFEEE